MGKLLKRFLEYWNNTPEEQLEKDWAIIKKQPYTHCPSKHGFKIKGAWCCNYHSDSKKTITNSNNL